MIRLIASAALLASASAASAAPQFVQHSGRLIDATGTPLNGALPTTFRLVDDEGGQQYAQSSTVSFQDGFYSVQLGALPVAALGEDLSVEITVDGQVLGTQQLASVPYALSVDGFVRVSDAPADCTGLGGTLRYSNGRLEVCDGTDYQPVMAANGVVDFKYAQTTAELVVSNTIGMNDNNLSITEGYELLSVDLAAKEVGNLLVFEGTVVWIENGNSSNVFTAAVFRESTGEHIGATIDSSHSNGGGCAYGSSYQLLCTTPIRVSYPAPSTDAETYQLRVGADGGILINRTQSGYSHNGKVVSSFSVTEYAQ